MASVEPPKPELETECPVNESAANDDGTETKIKLAPLSQETPEAINDSNNNDTNDNGTCAEGASAQNREDNGNEGNVVSETSVSEESATGRVAAGTGGNEPENDNEKTNLIVNYLPQQMTDEQFLNLFEKFGKMKSCKIVRNRMTGYSYGFGFVDFETHEQALKAIEELNGQEVDTKKIKVAFARPAGQDIKQANLYVKNIPTSWSQDDVRKVFEPYGQIIQVRVLGNDRGVAFVLYDLRKQAQDALEAMNGKQLEGCEAPFEIKFAAEKKGGEKRGNRGGVNRRGGRDRNNQRSGSLSGPRNNQNTGNNNNNNNNISNNSNNNRNNRGSSDNRRSTSQGRGGGNNNNSSSNNNNLYNKNNNFNNSNGNNQFGGGMNGGFGPVRQQPTNRMARYAPFVPAPQSAPMAPQGAPNPYYGYAQQQPMLPYMMPNQMMQMGQLPMGQQSIGMASGGPAMNPYAMAPQMGPIGYAQPAISQPSVAMSNMYNVASNTLANAAQMQPQLGQPMGIRSAVGGMGASGGGGGSGGGNGGGQPNDGVTLFVYNIGPECDENELRDMFAPYGTITRSNVVRKTPGGETKGFGFVTLKTRDQASAAINALNNAVKNGRSLQVSFKK